MVVAVSARATCAVCALLLTWLSAFACAAQHDSRPSQTQLSRVANLRYESATKPIAVRPWLLAAAGTTMVFAAGYAVSEGLVYKATQDRASALERSRDPGLDLDMRLQAESQASAARERADLFDRISDICLAGSVAATGATLLIWLTSKRRRRDHQQTNVLLGPMVLRGASGGGLVLREKF
jgi:hypothetical protein